MTASQLHSQAIKAAEAANTALLAFSRDAGVVSTEDKDIKTLADAAAERAILEQLEPTGIPVLSEEDPESHKISQDGAFWIVDPLDGTMNFSRQFPMWCVSIALWENNQPQLGVVLDPLRGLLYSGSLYQAASCNDSHVQVSDSNDPTQAILATGYPSQRDFSPASLERTARFNGQFKKVRMIGSSALSLAYVAQGTFDLYCEEDIWLWDVAAGLALIKAAGGDYCILNLSDDLRATVIAGPSDLVVKARTSFEEGL